VTPSRRSGDDERLDTYRSRRDFSRTREPAPGHEGGTAPTKKAPTKKAQGKQGQGKQAQGKQAQGKQVRGRAGDPVFVVQEHAASSHHFDVRLEVDGVLVSWAVPKGPSTDPREKRLAVPTEDHPMEYAEFEGTIPADDYGGGSVIVWDAGVYRNITERRGEPVAMRDGLDGGHVSVWLEGTKLVGGWSFTRTGDNWIMVKRRDGHADARRRPTTSQRESVLSGQTVDDVAGTED
jgi:DNA ligase D-like protein (predicted 3'-phosphoesterase)